MSLFQLLPLSLSVFFFFHDTAPTEIYTLSLHDALPISMISSNTMPSKVTAPPAHASSRVPAAGVGRDRKSTRLNSSHVAISYAVFCLKKKKKKHQNKRQAEINKDYRE